MRTLVLVFFKCLTTNKIFVGLCDNPESYFEELCRNCPTELSYLGDIEPASSFDLQKICDIFGGQSWHDPTEINMNWINNLISHQWFLDDLYSSGTNPHYGKVAKATNIQWQIITGSLMGNGYLVKVKNGYSFGITERKDRNWLRYKISELSSLGNVNYFEDKGTFRWRTRVNAISFDVFLRNHYNNDTKAINPASLEQIMDIGLMVWYMDKGFWRTPSTIAFQTSKINNTGNLALVEFLNSVDINATFKKYARSKQIVLDRAGTDKFLKLISAKVPDFMAYRLEP